MWDPLCFLFLNICFLFQVWDVLSDNFLKFIFTEHIQYSATQVTIPDQRFWLLWHFLVKMFINNHLGLKVLKSRKWLLTSFTNTRTIITNFFLFLFCFTFLNYNFHFIFDWSISGIDYSESQPKFTACPISEMILYIPIVLNIYVLMRSTFLGPVLNCLSMICMSNCLLNLSG